MKKIEFYPIIEKQLCTNCDKCIAACPTNAIYKENDASCAKCIKYCISMKVPCNPDHYVFCYEHCNACGLCIPACPVDAIEWYKVSK